MLWPAILPFAYESNSWVNYILISDSQPEVQSFVLSGDICY